MIRVATPADYAQVKTFANNFLAVSPYKDKYDEECLHNLISHSLTTSNKEVVVLLDDFGMIAGRTNPFMFGTKLIATEVGWWVEPEHRKTGIGKDLLDAFEFWAKEVGCDSVVMVSLDDALGKFYERNGYVLTERSYIKDLV